MQERKVQLSDQGHHGSAAVRRLHREGVTLRPVDHRATVGVSARPDHLHARLCVHLGLLRTPNLSQEPQEFCLRCTTQEAACSSVIDWTFILKCSCSPTSRSFLTAPPCTRESKRKWVIWKRLWQCSGYGADFVHLMSTPGSNCIWTTAVMGGGR